LNLPGKRAAENSVLALTIFDHLVDDAQNYLGAIEKVRWPGRMEKLLYNGRDIYVSGDHNPQGISSLIEILSYCSFEKVHFIVGICEDKNHTKMLELLTQVPNSILYITETTVKALPIQKYDKRFIEMARCVTPDRLEVLNGAISNASPNDMIVVTGSLYLVGYFYQKIEAMKIGHEQLEIDETPEGLYLKSLKF
jgi:dihydrofolate synthase/folylpolyglutamate synthase